VILLAAVFVVCATVLASLYAVLGAQRESRHEGHAEAMKRRELEVAAIVTKNEAALAALLERMAKLEQSKAMAVIGGGIAAGARR